ncbi:Hypothetical predicted protein [Mytilus galloprovincialis]|uniref:Uncharacterized protein n=1 Tax=Mytilus galloprovincialis TaxID=29158 RepID=A0A8B6EX82_MYTGA|nr:Hypothetical predicted protein [Mytilus galloprovincialis]
MAEAFLEMQDREFEMLLKDISDGSDLFGKSMTPPVYSPTKEIEDSRHFRFSPPRTEFSEYNHWESLQIEISPPSVSPHDEKIKKLEKRMKTRSGKKEPKTLLKKLTKMHRKIIEDVNHALGLTQEIQELLNDRRVPFQTLNFTEL